MAAPGPPPPPEPPRRLRGVRSWSGTPLPERDPEKVARAVWQQMGDLAGGWPIVLTGGVGSGKTCAALCFGDAWDRGAYITVADACADLIHIQNCDGRRDRWPCAAMEWWQRVIDTELLILDELGARERVSDHHYEVVKGILDRREGRPLIVVSNNSLGEIDRLYDSRIASRLRAGTVLNVAGRDRRAS
jgi:DNA replication protein DnaC